MPKAKLPRTAPPIEAAPIDLEDLVDVYEGARLLDMTHWTIRRFISEGRLPGYKLSPKKTLVSKKDLAALLQRMPTASGQ